MRIIEPNAGDLTNFEVLDFLRSRGAGKDRARLLASIATSEYKIIEQCEARIGLEKMDELVECVAQLLPSAQKPEENKSGEAIDKASDENLAGNEKESGETTDKISDENLAGNENIVT